MLSLPKIQFDLLFNCKVPFLLVNILLIVNIYLHLTLGATIGESFLQVIQKVSMKDTFLILLIITIYFSCVFPLLLFCYWSLMARLGLLTAKKTVVEKSQLLNYALQNKNAVALQVYEKWKKWDDDTQQAKVFGYSLVFLLAIDFFVSKSQSVSIYISSYCDHLGFLGRVWVTLILVPFILSFIIFQTGECESEYEIEASKILKSDGYYQ